MTAPEELNLARLLDEMEAISTKVRAAFKPYAPLPMAGSTASTQQEAAKADEFRLRILWDVPRRASVALRGAGEAVEATGRLLRPTPLFFMPGPVIRSGLEAAGLVLWLVESGIPLNERLQRAIAARKADLNDDLKLAHDGLAEASPDTVETIQTVVRWSKGEKEKFLDAASKLNLPAIAVPNDTELATLCGARYEYNLTTGLAHGNPTAYGAVESMFIGQGPTDDSAGRIFFTYATTVADAFCRAAWRLAEYSLAGEALNAFRQLFDAFYDEMHMNAEAREYFR